MIIAHPLIKLSVVSHGQQALVKYLLADLTRLYNGQFEVIITLNLPEDRTAYDGNPFPVHIIENERPKGFGANHNAAFRLHGGAFFAVVNPDIRIQKIDFEELLKPFSNPNVGAVAPVVLGRSGNIEDSVRRFPTIARLARRVFFKQRHPDYHWDDRFLEVDWAAGMFIVFRQAAFNTVKGFDEQRFFMYLEDVDICRRLWKHGWSVVLQPRVSVIHDAQRASHKDMKHLRWHLTSTLRYLSGL